MLARLGDVLYWVFYGAAALWTVACLYRLLRPDQQLMTTLALAAAGGILLWGLGRAFRYVLAGK
jgi:hypothetical protein